MKLFWCYFVFITCSISSAIAAPAYFPNIALPEAKTIEAGTGGDKSIILIVVCPSRPDHLSVYGYDKKTTTHLEQLAESSLVFTRMYANTPWTRASTASIMTGKFGSHHDVQQDIDRLDPKHKTIAEYLKAAGYRTAGFIGNGNASSIADLHRGYELYHDPKNTWHRLGKANHMVDEALTWLKKVKNQKHFMTLFFVDPHDPYQAPKKYEKQYLGNFTGEILRNPKWEYNNNYSKDQRFSVMAIYDAAYNFTDDQIGRFFKHIKKMGLYDSATIIMTGDHGEGFGEHGYWLHAHHLENEITRIPLIIKRPHLKPAGHYTDQLVMQADILPTIMDIAKLPIPQDTDGVPLLKALTNKEIGDDRLIFSEYNEFGIRRAAAITKDAKLILQRPANKEYLSKRLMGNLHLLPTVNFEKEVYTLYNLSQDPFEKKNVWNPNDPIGQKLLHALREHFKRFEE